MLRREQAAASPAPAQPAAPTQRTGVWQSKRALTNVQLGVTYLVLGLGLAFVLLPMFWLISTALKYGGDIYAYPPVFLSIPLYWQSFVEIFQFPQIPMALFIRNSLIVTTPGVLGTVLSSAMAAFAFARLRWWGRDVLFALTLATMMLPSQVTLIPTYIVFKSLGWLDTWFPLIVPSLFGAPVYIFLLRQFFLSIPLELEDAAYIDGANALQILIQLFLPLSRPALTAVTVFQFIGSWNDFMGPLIYLTDTEKRTISIGLQSFLGQYGADWTHLMAASVMATVPILVVFFIAQRYFIQGIVTTGLTGR